MQDFERNCSYDEKEAAHMLRDVSEAYYYAVCAAEKFNALTVAHKHQLNRAVDRASELGKLVEVLTKAVKDEI